MCEALGGPFACVVALRRAVLHGAALACAGVAAVPAWGAAAIDQARAFLAAFVAFARLAGRDRGGGGAHGGLAVSLPALFLVVSVVDFVGHVSPFCCRQQ